MIPSEANWDFAKPKCKRVRTSAASRDFGRITWRCSEVVKDVKELRSQGNPHFLGGQVELRFRFSWSCDSDFPNHIVAIGISSPGTGNATIVFFF